MTCDNDFYTKSYNEIVLTAGDYPDNTTVFPTASQLGLTSIALSYGTRLQMWSGKNFSGKKVLDVVGPLLIYTQQMQGSLLTHNLLGKFYSVAELQVAFPPANRKLAPINQTGEWIMGDVGKTGSCKISFGNATSSSLNIGVIPNPLL